MADAATHAIKMWEVLVSNAALNFAFAAAVSSIDHEAQARRLEANEDVLNPTRNTVKAEFYGLLAVAAPTIPSGPPEIYVGEIADLGTLSPTPGSHARMMWTVLTQVTPMKNAFSAVVAATDEKAKEELGEPPDSPTPDGAKEQFYRQLEDEADNLGAASERRWV